MGIAVVVVARGRRWRHVAILVGASRAADDRAIRALRRVEEMVTIRRPLPMVATDAALEPGVFGLVRPVVVWSTSLNQHLDDQQLDAILVHELEHVRVCDNLTACIPMLVESVFWFHPLVWWVSARLIDERERACDEAVLAHGCTPEHYASGILRVCRHSLDVRLTCMAGVTDGDLKKRMERIMNNHTGEPLNRFKKFVLWGSAVVLVACPILFGMFSVMPMPAHAAERYAVVSTATLPSFQTISIKPNSPGSLAVSDLNGPNGQYVADNVTLRRLIRDAYEVESFQVSGGPDWLDADRFSIAAYAPGHPTKEQMQLMRRKLLADRFRLSMHTATQELSIYRLVIARRDGELGAQIHHSAMDCSRVAVRPSAVPPPGVGCGFGGGPGSLGGQGVRLPIIAKGLSRYVRRVVVDGTGLDGPFDLTLQWPTSSTSSGDVAPLLSAVHQQLGLVMRPEIGPVDVFVIDEAERPSMH
jgi:bla regulator protein BlaR1